MQNHHTRLILDNKFSFYYSVAIDKCIHILKHTKSSKTFTINTNQKWQYKNILKIIQISMNYTMFVFMFSNQIITNLMKKVMQIYVNIYVLFYFICAQILITYVINSFLYDIKLTCAKTRKIKTFVS